MKSVCSKGISIAEIFAHFDKDKGGTISKEELAKGLSAMKDFQDLREADLVALISSMHAKAGEIALKDFETFVELDPPQSSIIASTTVGVPDSSKSSHEQFAIKVRDIFRKASEKGMSIDGLFSTIDKNGDGNLTTLEFKEVLSKLKGFKDISTEDINYLVKILDRDGDGKVSIVEFKSFVANETAVPKLEEKDLSDRELFIRQLKRIGEPDGGFDALLAYMDDDEDGLISYVAFMRMLRREGVLGTKNMSEVSIENLIRPMMCKDDISVTALIRFVDGSDSLVPLKAENNEAEDVLAVNDYEYSRDPEIHALEKKMRGLGRILAKKGINVEDLFRKCDVLDSGVVRRTEFIEILSKMGLYILEQGRVLEEAGDQDTDPLRKQQVHQVNKLKGTSGSYSQNAPRAARRLVMSGVEAKEGDFNEHLESMALVNWYRQSQKKLLLQRVLSHSLAETVRIYPRFGKTLFFEFPVTNPFSHEERFIIDVNDPELRLVTAFDEWLHLRQTCRSATGNLGPEPVEAEMFDRDGFGNVQVVLLPSETLHIPFTFMTLLPYSRASKSLKIRANAESKSLRRDGHQSKSGESKFDEPQGLDIDDEPSRSVEVKVVSGSHGHVMSVLKVLVCPRPFSINRTLRFYEPENSIMKRRIQLIENGMGNGFPSDSLSVSKFVHCVENDDVLNGQSNVVIEWGPSDDGSSLDMLFRYRCGAFPDSGSFYLIIYNDPYQSQLHEVRPAYCWFGVFL